MQKRKNVVLHKTVLLGQWPGPTAAGFTAL